MSEPFRVVLAVALIVIGLGMVGYAGYLQYASLPEERTFARHSKLAALALAGVLLMLVGIPLLP
jgi:hypothetical protein